MVTQVTCSVFDVVVSNPMQMMESVQFHDFNRSTVKSAMISPDILSVLGSYAGTPSSFISLAVPTRTETRFCWTMMTFVWNPSAELQV